MKICESLKGIMRLDVTVGRENIFSDLRSNPIG